MESKPNSFLPFFMNSLKKMDTKYLAYLMANTKVEKNLFGQIGYQMDLYFQSKNSNLFTVVEYSRFHATQKNTKRIDFAVIEHQSTKTEDKFRCAFEGKCYYTWDSADYHWKGKWFNPKFETTSKDSKIPFLQCRSTVSKIKRMQLEPALQNVEIFFVLFLIHFGKKVPRSFPYFSNHNKAVREYDNNPEKLIPQSKKLVDVLFPKLGLNLIHYGVNEELTSYKCVSMGLITAIGKVEENSMNRDI